MAYEKTIWVNDDEPFIEADNLNKIENELELLDTTKSDLINAINNPTYTTTEGTDLSIDNTRVGNMKFEYYGNTEQTTYEGNQLLDFENPSSATASTTSVFLNDVLTISSTSGSYRNASWDILTLLQGNADKTLKFVYKTINDNPYKAVQIRIKNNGTNTYINLLSENLIIPSDVSGITEAIISVFSNNSSTSREATTIITEPMLQLGTIVKDYEPYTGRIAAPNPDYPQEVKTVTGENTITIENEDGTKSQSYEINLGSLEICKIGDYQDYIYNNGGKWFKHKEVESMVLTGASTESWAVYAATGGTPRRFGMQDASKFYANNILIISDHFVGSDIPTSTTPDLTIWTQVNYLGITDRNSKWANATALKAWLQSNNVTVYYKSQTSIEEEITEPTLINQLNAIKYGAESYYDTTNIMVTSEELQPILKVQTLDKIV